MLKAFLIPPDIQLDLPLCFRSVIMKVFPPKDNISIALQITKFNPLFALHVDENQFSMD